MFYHHLFQVPLKYVGKIVTKNKKRKGKTDEGKVFAIKRWVAAANTFFPI